jgi:Holliday junction resolvase RusA-like endonuclease
MTTESDVERAMSMVEALGCSRSDGIWYTVIPGNPPSKSRPRFTRSGHAFTPKDDRILEARTKRFLSTVMDGPQHGNLAMGCVFFRPNRQRIDVDNMLKHVCDAATGVLWDDDSQVTALLGVAELAPDNPRTIIVIAHHVSTLLRGDAANRPCPICGKAITPKDGPRKACSSRCATAMRGQDLSEPIECPICKEMFRRRTRSQKHCSQKCGWRSRSGVPKGVQTLPSCAECGKQLSKKGYVRCRDCWRAARGRSEA